MAVTTTTQIVRRSYAGYDDPRLPSGYWIGGVQSFGLAGGGINTARIDFLLTPGDLSGFFSLEQMSCRVTGVGDITVRLGFQNFIREVAADQAYGIECRITNGATEAFMDLRERSGLPIFLGSRRFANTTTFISAQIANSDGQVLTFHCEGYIWTPQAMNIQGGLQRPANGLYSGS